MNEMNEDDNNLKILREMFPTLYISYGGDGTLVENWRHAYKEKKAILPIRNYARCKVHEDMFQDFIKNSKDRNLIKDYKLKLSQHQLLAINYNNNLEQDLALAEFQLKNADITSAMRFNILINGNYYYKNVIADAIIISSVLGSTGYWQSITKSIFRQGFGLTFIAPTVGISSLILKPTDRVSIEIVRNTKLNFALDKISKIIDVKENDIFDITASANNFSMFGYSEFMCFDCRKNRNSTILQNQYII